MRRSVIIAGVVLLACLCGPARAATPPCVGTDLLDELAREDPARWQRVLTDAKATINTEARLWRIERAGTPASYLLGTLHSTDPRITALSPALQAAIAATRRTAIEIADVSSSAMLDVIKTDPDLVLYLDGRSIAQQLTAAEMQTVVARLRLAGMPAELVASLRPWFAYTLLSLPDCERVRKSEGINVLDLVVAEQSRRQGSEVVGLESIEEQLGALAAVPEAEQFNMLRMAVAWSDRSADVLESVQQRYLRREMGAAWPLNAALAAKAGIASRTFRGFQEKVVVDRNFLMRDRSLPYLAEGRTLIAVGALHLTGEYGLVALYRQAGYTVTPVE